jgi:hypothetical protein
MTEQPERAQAIDSPAEERVPLWVESPRGDDRFGTNTTTGEVISDFEAKKQGVPFQQDVPQSMIQDAVEGQLKDDKWVQIEKKSGETELLTKNDIPADEPDPECCEAEQEETDGESEEPDTEGESWKDAFNVKPAAKPAKADVKNDAKATSSCAAPKKEKEVWESKFKSLKSATATHKSKGG